MKIVRDGYLFKIIFFIWITLLLIWGVNSICRHIPGTLNGNLSIPTSITTNQSTYIVRVNDHTIWLINDPTSTVRVITYQNGQFYEITKKINFKK